MANHDSVASPFDQLEFQTRISRCASMAISTQEGGTRKRRNLSLRCNSEANSSGTESQGPPFTAHFGYAGKCQFRNYAAGVILKAHQTAASLLKQPRSSQPS